MPSPGEFAEALRERRQRKRRRTWIISLSSALLVIVAGALVWLFYFSDVLDVRETVVDGNSLLTSEQVEEAAQVPEGSLARVDVGAITGRLRDLPEVKDVEVRREFPNTVAITVVERVPVFQLRSDGGFSWVDDEGEVFRTEQDTSDELPEVSVTEPETRLLSDISTIVEAIPEELAGQVELITAESVDRVELQLAGGRSVVWGSAEESELKGEVLTALLGVDATVYDVSAPNHPTTS